MLATILNLLRGGGGKMLMWLAALAAIGAMISLFIRYGEQREQNKQLHEAVKIYAQQWEDEADRRKLLDEELARARGNVVKAQEEVSKHDFRKIYDRHPRLLVDILNRNTQRMFNDLRAAANGKEATTPHPY